MRLPAGSDDSGWFIVGGQTEPAELRVVPVTEVIVMSDRE